MRFIAAVIVAAAALAGCSASPSQGHTVVKIPVTTAPAVPRVAPARIDIPRIDAHSSLIPTGLNRDQSLATPDVKRPQQVSYYCVVDTQKICSSGVIPGQPGPAVILGHIDGAGQKGIFYNLGNMQVGDVVTVTLKDGTVLTFQVYRKLQQSKNLFPTQVVYQPTSIPEIRLITCTGPWVGGVNGYGDNLIVFASLVPNPPGVG